MFRCRVPLPSVVFRLPWPGSSAGWLLDEPAGTSRQAGLLGVRCATSSAGSARMNPALIAARQPAKGAPRARRRAGVSCCIRPVG